MIINPEKTKEYRMVKSVVLIRDMARDKIKTFILSTFPDDIPKPKPTVEQLEFEPGHGLKGKKEWILDDNDLSEFKKLCKGKKNGELTLWCYSKDDEKKTPKRVPDSKVWIFAV